MDNFTAMLGSMPTSFNYDAGTRNHQKLTKLGPTNDLLVPPPGAPAGTVGLEACEKLAGPGYSPCGHVNTLDVLATWVVPLLVLVVNMNYASFFRQKYWNELTIALQLWGNPVDAIWALLTKLDVKRRVAAQCRDHFRDSGLAPEEIWIYSTILYALDDFGFAADFQGNFEELMHIAHSDEEKLRSVCKRAAIDFTFSRVNNTRRAVFAILGYLTAITFNILRADSSDDVPVHLSHTIALRVLNYWLIPAIILSAIVGGLPSEWTAVGILDYLQRDTGLRFWLEEVAAMEWREPDLAAAERSVASITIAAFISFMMSYFTPTVGAGTRCVVELAFWSWWCINATVAYLIGRYKAVWAATERGWLILIAKDSVFALFTILFVLSAWNGWWNSCDHWSMTIQLGKEKAYIDLVGMKGEIHWLMTKRFSIAMALTTATQLMLAFAMIWYAQGGLTPSMKEETAAAYYAGLLSERNLSDTHKTSEPLPVKNQTPAKRRTESEVSLMKGGVCVSTATV